MLLALRVALNVAILAVPRVPNYSLGYTKVSLHITYSGRVWQGESLVNLVSRQ